MCCYFVMLLHAAGTLDSKLAFLVALACDTVIIGCIAAAVFL